MEKLILTRTKNYKSKINEIFAKIKQYKRIAIFRHDHPDYDAFGSQLAFVNFIKDNFKDKEVIFVGDNHVTLSGKCFPKMMEVKDSWFDEEFLAIILDLANLDRVADERCKKAACTIKIDHHPDVDNFGDIQIVDTSMIAAGELLAAIFLSNPKYFVSKETASYLYKAIVGDSGRFKYAETSALTFYIAQKLIEKGINISKIYKEMYDEKQGDLEVRKFILDNYKITKHGVAYYILTKKELEKFNLVPIQGKDNINTFANIQGIGIWASCTEDQGKGNWRVSVRSSEINIEETCAKHNGGGHPQACGCKVKNVKEFEALIKDLDALLK